MTTATTLQKKTRSSDPGRKREIFAEALSKLWDIGASDAIQTSKKIRCCQRWAFFHILAKRN